MNTLLRQTLGDQMEALRHAIQASYTWESPEGAFARYLCACNRCTVPFQLPDLSAISAKRDSEENAQLKPRQLAQAPTLAAVGYEIAVGRKFDLTVLTEWAEGFERLSTRDAFPVDRMSFFFRPLELLGIALGARNCPNISPDAIARFKTMLIEGESRLIDSDDWTVILGSWAVESLEAHWQPRRISIKDCSLSELALMIWLTQKQPEFAQRLEFAGLAKEAEQSLLQQSVMNSIDQSDSARSMLLYLVLERTLTQVLSFDSAFSQGYTPDGVIQWLKAIVDHSNGLIRHLHSSGGRLEFASHDQTWQISMLIADLERAIHQLQPLLAGVLQPKFQISRITNILGDQITMNNPQTRAEVQQIFNAPVYGVAGNVEGNQNVFTGEQRQTLAAAAQEIQQLLQQLEKSNPDATGSLRSQFVTMAIEPSRRQRFTSALNAGWKETIKEFLDNAYLNVAIAILEGWQNPKS